MIIYDDPMKLRTELQKDQITQYHDGYNAKKPESLWWFGRDVLVSSVGKPMWPHLLHYLKWMKWATFSIWKDNEFIFDHRIKFVHCYNITSFGRRPSLRLRSEKEEKTLGSFTVLYTRALSSSSPRESFGVRSVKKIDILCWGCKSMTYIIYWMTVALLVFFCATIS